MEENMNNRLPSKTMFLGDIHGNAHYLEQAIDIAIKSGIKSILQVGDFYIYKLDNHIKEKLVDNDINVYFIAGNHENWKLLSEFEGEGVTKFDDNLYYIPTGAEFTVGDMTAIAIGGAVSIDKHFRIEGFSWFPEEVLSEEEQNKLMSKDKNYDLVVSHDCPSGIDMPSECTPASSEDYFGKEVIREANENREMLDKIFEKLSPDYIFHGHYHHYYKSFSHSYGGVICTGLNLDMQSNCAVIFDSDKKEMIAIG